MCAGFSPKIKVDLNQILTGIFLYRNNSFTLRTSYVILHMFNDINKFEKKHVGAISFIKSLAAPNGVKI